MIVRIRLRWSAPAAVRAKSKPLLPKSMLLAMALVASAEIPKCTEYVPPMHTDFHAITVRQLTAFMQGHGFAKPYYVREIVQTAETNRIPASLLVCIELLETSGGKQYAPERWNRFGWDNGKASFASHLAAIRFIAWRLGSGRYYAGKTIEEKIRVYNPRPVYTQKVSECMREIGERPTLTAGIR